MPPKAGDTYIEKPKYFKDRVAIVKRVANRKQKNKEYVFLWFFHLDTLTVSHSNMPLSSFVQRFQKSWLTMRVQRRRVKPK